MSSLLSLEKTPMQAIYEHTCLDLIRELSKNLSEDKPTMESFTSINGLDKSVQEINFTEGVKDLYKQYHNPQILSDSNPHSMRWKYWNPDMDILKLGNHDMSINEAMEIAGNLFKDIGHQFYGMLLTTKGGKKDRTIFNPLHPIMVAELKKEHSTFNLDAKHWSISIYSFKDDKRKNNDVLLTRKNYINEIATIISSINSPANYVIENKGFHVDIINDKFVLDYEEIKRERTSNNLITEDDSGDRNYIIPSQIINIAGIAYPYYGVTYSRKGLAWNMTPLYHANIGHPHNQSTHDGMEGGSRICTHSGNSKTQMGVSSLNHSNTTSPLNSALLCQGAMEYSEQSLSASLEMFLGDEFLKSQGSGERVLTFKEFKKENDGVGTKKQYLSYIKNRMADKMDMEQDNIEPEPTTIVHFENGTVYPFGAIVKYEGRAYEAIAEEGASLIPEPGNTVVWKDLSPEAPILAPEPTIMDIPPIDLNTIVVPTEVGDWNEDHGMYTAGEIVRHDDQIWVANRNTGLRPNRTPNRAWTSVDEPVAAIEDPLAAEMEIATPEHPFGRPLTHEELELRNDLQREQVAR